MLRSSLFLGRRAFSRGSLATPPAPFLALPKTAAIVGAPFNLGQPLLGVEAGPNAVRQADLKQKITNEGWRFLDTGDLAFPPLVATAPRATAPDLNLNLVDEVGAACRTISDAVYKQASEGKFVITLGGDHSIAIGTVTGILRARPDTGIVWVDAHGDINTPATSSSGNLHGMCVSFAMGHVDLKPLPQFAWLDALLKQGVVLRPDRIVYIGLRDLDAGEKLRLRTLGVKAFSMQQIDKYGIGKVMEMALAHLGTERPLHLSFDIDSVDPAFAPGTGTKVRGGLTDREAHYICEAVAETSQLGSLDMVEVNPSLAPGDVETATMASKLIGAAMGDTIL